MKFMIDDHGNPVRKGAAVGHGPAPRIAPPPARDDPSFVTTGDTESLDFAIAIIEKQRDMITNMTDQIAELRGLLKKIDDNGNIGVWVDVPHPGISLDYSYINLTEDEIALWNWAIR